MFLRRLQKHTNKMTNIRINTVPNTMPEMIPGESRFFAVVAGLAGCKGADETDVLQRKVCEIIRIC